MVPFLGWSAMCALIVSALLPQGSLRGRALLYCGVACFTAIAFWAQDTYLEAVELVAAAGVLSGLMYPPDLKQSKPSGRNEVVYRTAFPLLVAVLMAIVLWERGQLGTAQELVGLIGFTVLALGLGALSRPVLCLAGVLIAARCYLLAKHGQEAAWPFVWANVVWALILMAKMIFGQLRPVRPEPVPVTQSTTAEAGAGA